MKVIIPAAGFGSRLRPHTFVVPKVMLPVAGKPILEYIIKQALEWGGDEVCIIYGHLGEQVERFVRERFPIKSAFRLQEERLGLAHAVLMGIDDDDRDIIIILGDTITETDLKPVIQAGKTGIGVKQVGDPRQFGVAVVADDKVRKLVEKPIEPESNLALVGVYYIRDAGMLKRAIEEIIQKGITVKGEYQLTDALQLMLDWGEEIAVFPVTGWFDCGKPETLLDTNRYILSRDGGHISDTVTTENSIIIPPVWIGARTKLIRSIVGPFVSIGAGTEISDAILTDSIIGDRVVIKQVLLTETLVGSRAEVYHHFRRVNIGASSWIHL